ncbi:beta-N-acetylhexosaminidase [Luteolibacter sp. GHJ8]|uniref:beta-N-acetylhexosaminidase n=1 Tax=Luteolibacter rhizosphaerae TaxID=2989719 RepID=A0ABT3G1B0_9BACT|nr:beta-N-acetylhexosaminidase [Luteolibacter rhizosphaerae]MCW1913617.1 beta-N-acetylhexosaminidase [Luteolibacter rhizosphaerae]
MRKALLAAALVSCLAAEPAIIPLPKEMKAGEGSFPIVPNTSVRYEGALDQVAKLFADDLGARTGNRAAPLREDPLIELASEIRLKLDPALPLRPGGYKLEVSPEGTMVTGKDMAGVWYGTRSLLQLLPPIGSADWKKGAAIPAVSITDEPRFGWRGMHLDVSRHLHAVEDIKKFIDWLAFHKLNTLHWHITDDQGWRVEIKKYPKLTEIGGYRDSTPPYGNRDSDDGKRYGGFYTQEQIKEVVAYAAARQIAVVPEIDMPGHMAAAITAYPELGNSDIPNYSPKVRNRWGIHFDTLAPTEETFKFVDDVLTEICAIFPSTYIHIGGDEAPKDQWEQSPRVRELMKKEGMKDGHDVQSYFVKRVEKILAAKGRKLIGWDEIREGGLAPNATVMSWRGEAGAVASAKEGHDVVMASTSHLYLDHYQLPKNPELAKGVEFEAWGGFQPIYNVYSYDPVPKGLNAEEAKHILGVQAQLWAEYLKTWDKVEYTAFPRIAALAEIAWTPVEKKNYEDFRSRLDPIMAHYKAAGVRHAQPLAPPKRQTKDGSTIETSLRSFRAEFLWPELAYDGDPETFFWSAAKLKAGDHFTLTLRAAVSGKKVKVVTGDKVGPFTDKLDRGVLEASSNGQQWTEITAFKDGVAEGTAPEGTTSLRIRVTAAQEHWISIGEIEIE